MSSHTTPNDEFDRLVKVVPDRAQQAGWPQVALPDGRMIGGESAWRKLLSTWSTNVSARALYLFEHLEAMLAGRGSRQHSEFQEAVIVRADETIEPVAGNQTAPTTRPQEDRLVTSRSHDTPNVILNDNLRIQRRKTMVSSNTLDLEGRREIAISVATGLEEIGGYGRGVVINGRSFASAGALSTFLRSAATADIDDILRQLNRLETKALEQQRRVTEVEADAQARTEADPLFPVKMEDIVAAQERAEHDATVEGKLDRLIEINTRIAEALEKR